MSDSTDITIAAVGDIMPGISYSWRHAAEPSAHFAYHHLGDGAETIVGSEPLSLLRDADLTIGNLEAVISAKFDEANSDAPPILMTPPETADFLRDSGFDVVHIDNNHILDHGEEFVEETKEHLDAAGIRYIGSPVGEEEPLSIPYGDTQIHLAGYNLVNGGRITEKADILAAARDLASRPGISILSLHWGWENEHMLYPSPDQISFARELMDTGIDVLLGHHSHTFQPVEETGNGIIAYSLGNFLFDMWRPDNSESGVLEIEVDVASSGDRDLSARVLPVKNRKGTVEKAHNRRISESVTENLAAVSPEQYDEQRQAARSRHNRRVIKKFVENSYRLPPDVLLSTLKGWSRIAYQKIR